MQKVLQILSGLNRGGMETFIMNVYRSINREEIQFDFLISRPGDDYEEEAKELGATVYYSGSRRRDGVIGYCRNLDFFFKEHAWEYIAVHYHESTLTAMEPLFYAKKYGIKNRILHSHSSSVSGSKLHYVTHTINKIFVRSLANTYLGCSEKAIKWFYKGTGIFSKAQMIDNGINVRKFAYNENLRFETRNNLGLQQDALVIGHIGRFIWIKNHKFLLDIFKKIVEIKPESRLLLIGQGPLLEETKDLSIRLNLQDNVIFLGLRSDIPELLQAIDIVVMPSYYEGLPVSLVEAQAAGLLVFSSDTISKDTKITSNMHFLSLQDSPDKWANTILNKYGNFQRTTKSVEEVIKAGYDIQSIANKLINIYKS